MTYIKMPVQGKAEVQFWMRAFKLEDEVDNAVHLLQLKDQRKSAFVPIISEHEVGKIKWVFLLAPTIDSLGIQGGGGVVWLTTGKEHLATALEERNKLAAEIIEEAERQGKFDELIEMEPKKDV